MRFDLSQSGLKSVITAGIFSLVAIGVLFNWAVPVSAENAAPAKPDTPTLRALHQGMVEVDWNDVSGANRYEVQFYTSSGWIDLPNAGLGIEIFFDGSRAVATGLPEDLGYDAFHVRAGNSVGWSEWSEYAWQMTTHNMDWEGIPVPTIEPTPEPVNTPATGAPAVTGTAQVGETLTAETSGIADADGLSGATFTYQWIANDGSADTDITGATDSSYVLVAAADGKTIKVRVSFADDEGNDESLTSAATATVAAAPNSPATGAPAVTGTAEVGETLTAETSGIADADGLGGATFTYQWIANDGTADTDIRGATDSSYVLVAADDGKTIKVWVSFTDDAANKETLTSTATEAVSFAVQQQIANSPATGAPAVTGTAQVGETLTADTSGIADADGLNDVSYSYQWVRKNGSTDTDIQDATDSSYTLVAADDGKTIKVRVSFADDEGNDESLTSAATATVAAAPNSPATGAPAVTGTAEVGKTLTAETSGIVDDDGLSGATFTYQWVANDGTADTDIQDATGSTYTLVSADESQTIQVRVSFTDDGGNDETLTSVSTAAVAAEEPPAQEPPAQPTGLTGTVSHDAVSLSWDDPGDESVTGYQVLRRDKALHAVGVFLVHVDDTGSAETTYTDTDVAPSVRYVYRIKARNVAGLSERSKWFNATTPPAPTPDPNSAATALTLGIPLGGTIDPGNDEDYFKLVLSTAQTILVWTTGDLDTVGELQDSGGMELESNDYGGLPEGPHNFVIWRDVQDGTYYLKVSSRDEVTGAYVLHAISIQDTTSTSNAVTVSPDSSTPALVEKRFDYDYFKLTLAAETDLIIRTTGSVLETYMEILDNSQTQIATNNYGLLPPRDTHALIRRSLAAGTYFIKVRGPVATESLGPYTLHIRTVSEPGDSITNAIPLVIHRAEGGNVDSATDADYFRIDVAETTHLRIRAVSETVDIDGALLDSGGQSLPAIFYEETLLGGDAMVFRLRRTLDAGTYYVKVTRSGGAEAGPYTILMVDDPDLEALLDRCSGLDTTVSDPLFGCQWNLRNTGQLGGTAGEDINVEPVWAGGNMGAGITVVVVDDHLDLLHEDLTTDAAKSHQYYDPPYYVDHSHATDVAGIIAGRDNNLGVRGVAPRATVIGHDATAAGGFFVVLPVPLDALTRNMDVAAVYNNSYAKSSGAEPETAPRSWEEALQTGVSDGYGGKGVFYVFGAGNDAEEGGNVNLDEYANLHHVTTVCAVNDLGQRSAYSEEGANLWVCAPSNDGTRDRPLIFTTTNYSAYTDYFGGTSAAAPTVSGVAALVRAANTSLTWRDVKLILAASARKNDATNTGWEEGAFEYGSSTQRYEFNHEYGFGVVNAGAAVTLADSWTSLPAYIETTAAWDGPAAAIPDLPSSGTAVSLERAVVVGPDVEFTEFVEINVEFVAVTSADDVRQFRELEIELESPSGAVSVLAPAINDIAMCPLHDSCGLEGGFRFGSAKHLGEDPGGEWKLRITDRKTGSTPGTLESWSLTVYGHRIRPSAPELDEVFPASGGYTVIWKAPEDTGQSSITAYDVRHIKTSEDETDDANWTVVDSAWTTGALQYTAIGLDSTEPYDVQVRAVNDGGDGRWSSTSTVTPKTDEAPTIETITAGNGTLTVAWTAPTSTTLGTITAYDLRYGRGTPSSSWTTVDDAWTSGTLEYAIEPDPLLTNGVTYGVQVRAVVGTDDKPWSETRTGTPRTVPGAPSIRSVDDGSGGELIVEWNAPSSNGGADITGYDVRYIRSDATAKADGNWTEELAIWTSGTREHTIDSVDNWVRYDVQVRAENSLGKGSWSATEAGTPQEADVPSVTANFEQSSYNVTEGGDVSIAVTLSADPERSVAIPITTTNQGTATDADYSGVPLEVTFQSGDTEVTFTFTATDDPVDDDGEWVKVTFGALPAGVSEGTTTEATVSITDNDVSGVTVSETALTVPEGGTAGETYTVVLDSPPTADVVVTVAGHAGTEVTPSPTSLTFTTSNWNDAHTVTVKAGDDADTLDDTVTLTHMAQSTDSNYEGITIDGVAVTVNDDDTTNTPATGAPTIRGTVQVGETLTADTAGITDDDGLNNVSYGYQWIRNDGTSDTEIQDATGETYPLVDADEGQTIKVKVSFTDDADNEEALTSTATAEVAAAAPTEPPGRPRNLTGAANADGTVALSWDAPNDDTVTGYQILRRRPTEGEKTLLVHVNDTGSTATQHTDRDVTPDVGHAYRVKAINAVGLSRWSNFVNVTPVQPAEPAQNSPATGRPTISGTAQVGETLTAETSGIADADGLTNVSYSHQWIRNDGSTDTDIRDATGFSHTLVDADEGQTLQVRVSFTDDVGNDETLTSAATEAVAAKPNSLATGDAEHQRHRSGGGDADGGHLGHCRC